MREWGDRRAVAVVSLCAFLALLLIAAADAGADAITNPLPTNDLQGLLALTGVPTPAQAVIQHNDEPPVKASPRASCGRGSRPLAGTQGRVPASAVNSPEAARGWTCNVTPLGHFNTPGGFRTWRYVDRAGRDCAFYDASLPSPLNVVRVGLGPSPGVMVLDMSDPAHPKRTATLNSLPMLAPHESLNLNTKRGLLAAEMGNGTTLPGLMSIYDVSRDCRHPVLKATSLVSRFGHESGFALDGKTFWIGGGEGIAAIDVTDPSHPRNLWEGNVFAHGLNLNDAGTRLYDADPIDGNLAILDVSQVQARKPKPVVREISRLTWNTATIPQNTAPMKIGGHRYLLEFDEFGFRFTALVAPGTVGAARIIDVADDAHPRVVSNIRLAINQPAARTAAGGDPSSLPAEQFGYAAHYCAIPREVNPAIVACSFINSGLRIFNIQDPLHPREVAYYVAPPRSPSGGGVPANFALSQPAFVPERREVWYTDATSGFHAVRLTNGAWPAAVAGGCLARRSPIGPRNIGRVRIGYTRRRLLRLPVKPVRRTSRSYRYCVKGRRGRVTAVFGKRHRVVLVATTARGHGNRGVRVHSRAATFRHAYPRRRALGHGLFRASPRSPRVIRVRHGRVSVIAVASGALRGNVRVLRRYLRLAGL